MMLQLEKQLQQLKEQLKEHATVRSRMSVILVTKILDPGNKMGRRKKGGRRKKYKTGKKINNKKGKKGGKSRKSVRWSAVPVAPM